MGTTGDVGTDMRSQLVAAAVSLLAEEGPGVIQARRLAREVGASTMAVYHYFGGMPQLLTAVREEGFRRLDARLSEVAITDDPVTDIGRLGLAYRQVAWENPHLYDLMFGLSTPGGYRPEAHAPPAESDGSSSQRAYTHLVDAAARAIRAGRVREQDPDSVAAQFWSVLHGYVTLELSGHLDQLDGLNQVLIPMGINHLVGLGDAPEDATNSLERINTANAES
ncbi:transcriptional regulator, TetR family [Haloechinothrix alba]|uniref:Transcriptional regulator, TetR family n=1 Tax=Haloechinothrix alba TaxID=664784 RepID=A0A238YW28_9PSEU|nr:TetR/AcrR family transcriptional regulator [Haloechinothrix alba]SNR74931.1 transcriptional regulator, TetR family [Haloechinothrix alba]